MARIKGLRKLRAELRRFHDELSRITSVPFHGGEHSDAREISDEGSEDSGSQDDDAVWDSVNSAGPSQSFQNEAEQRKDMRASREHTRQAARPAEVSSSKDSGLEELNAVAGDQSRPELGVPPIAELPGDKEHATSPEKGPLGSGEGCGELSCKAAIWNGQSQCECHIDQVLRISATSLFTSNVGHVLSAEKGGTNLSGPGFYNVEVQALQPGSTPSQRRAVSDDITVHKTTGTRSDVAEDTRSLTTSEALNISASHQIAYHCRDGIQTLLGGTQQVVGHAPTPPINIDRTGSVFASGFLIVNLATNGSGGTRVLATTKAAVLPQPSTSPFAGTAGHPDGKSLEKQTQAPELSEKNRLESISNLETCWKKKGRNTGSKEDVSAAKMAHMIKQALQMQGTEAELKHAFEYRGILQGGVLSRFPKRYDEKLKYIALTGPPSAAPKDIDNSERGIDAQSYLQAIMAALSPQEQMHQAAVQKGSHAEGAVSPKRPQEKMSSSSPSEDEGTCDRGTCMCPNEPTEDKGPGPFTAWVTTTQDTASKHFDTVLEVPPVSITYAPNSCQVQPDKQEYVSVQAPYIHEEYTECPSLDTFQQHPAVECNPLQCMLVPHCGNQEAMMAKDPTEKRFEAATRLLYNLDSKNGRSGGECAFSRDCRWNRGNMYGRPKLPIQKKAAQPQYKGKPQVKRGQARKGQQERGKAKGEPQFDVDKRIAVAAAGLADDIEALVGNCESSKCMHEHVPCRYTRLDAPVEAAAQAVSRLTQDAVPEEVVQSRWRQFFATQSGRTVYAQEAVKNMIGGGIDFDQFHQELNDIRKERDRIKQLEEVYHRFKQPFSTDKQLLKCWQEPCLVPGYQGENQDEMFLNSLRQEVESRIACVDTGARTKRRKVGPSPSLQGNKKIIQPSSRNISQASIGGIKHQIPDNSALAGSVRELLLKRPVVAQPVCKRPQLEKLVKEVQAMLKKGTQVATGTGQHSSKRVDVVAPRFDRLAAKTKPPHPMDGVEEGRPGRNHFVRAALRRKEVRPPESLFKAGAPTKWMGDVVRHPPPSRRGQADDVHPVKQQVSPSTKKSRKGAVEPKQTRRLVTAAESKAKIKQGSDKAKKKVEKWQIAGPVIDFDNPYEPERDLYPVPKSKGSRKRAEKPKAKKHEIGPRNRNPVIDFSKKFEDERNLQPLLRLGQKAEKRRNQLESEWNRLEKDKRLVEIYGASLPRKKFQHKATEYTHPQNVANLYLKAGGSRQDAVDSSSTHSHKGLAVSHLKRKGHIRSPRSRSRSPLSEQVDDWVIDKGLNNEKKMKYPITHPQSRIGGRPYAAPRGGHFDHLNRKGHTSSPRSRSRSPFSDQAGDWVPDKGLNNEKKMKYPITHPESRIGGPSYAGPRGGHFDHLNRKGLTSSPKSRTPPAEEEEDWALDMRLEKETKHPPTHRQNRIGGSPYGVPKGGPSHHLSSHPGGPSHHLSSHPGGPSHHLSSHPEGPSHNLSSHPGGPSHHLSSHPGGPSHHSSSHPGEPSHHLSSHPGGPSHHHLSSHPGGHPHHHFSSHPVRPLPSDPDPNIPMKHLESRPLRHSSTGAEDEHVESSGPSPLTRELNDADFDGFIETLTAEVQEEILKLRLSKDRAGNETFTAEVQEEIFNLRLNREHVGKAGGKETTADSSEERYESDEFHSDTEDPAFDPKYQPTTLKSLEEDLTQEKRELEDAVLKHALKEIMLKNVLSDQERHHERMQLQDGVQPESDDYPVPAREYQAETSRVIRGNLPLPQESDRYQERAIGVQTPVNRVSIVGVQTTGYEQKYAGVQTTDYDKKYAAVQTTDYDRRYAESQTNERKYAGIQTIPSEGKYAGVQTSHFENYGESQTTASERRYASAQTMSLDEKYASVQTMPAERKYASIQTDAEMTRSVQTAMDDEAPIRRTSMAAYDSRWTAAKTGYDPLSAQMNVHEGEVGWDGERAHASKKVVSALQSVPSSSKIGYYEPAYGQMKLQEGEPGWDTSREEKSAPEKSAYQTDPGSSKAVYSKPTYMEAQEGELGLGRTREEESAPKKSASAFPSSSQTGYLEPSYGQMDVQEGRVEREGPYEESSAPKTILSALQGMPSGSKSGYAYLSPEYSKMEEWHYKGEQQQDRSDPQSAQMLPSIKQERNLERPSSPPSPSTPSTPSSDPLHEAMLAAALAPFPELTTTNEEVHVLDSEFAAKYGAEVPGAGPSEAARYGAEVPGAGPSEAARYGAQGPGSGPSAAARYGAEVPGSGPSETARYGAEVPGAGPSGAARYGAEVPGAGPTEAARGAGELPRADWPVAVEQGEPDQPDIRGQREFRGQSSTRGQAELRGQSSTRGQPELRGQPSARGWTETGVQAEVEEDIMNVLLSRRHLRRVEATESVALFMISKAVRSDSSRSSSSESSAASFTIIQPQAQPSSPLSPGEVAGAVSMNPGMLRRRSSLEQDLGTRYFRLRRYSSLAAKEAQLQDHPTSSQMSEGETDIGALLEIDEPGQTQFVTGTNPQGEPGEITLQQPPTIQSDLLDRNSDRSRSEGELDVGQLQLDFGAVES